MIKKKYLNHLIASGQFEEFVEQEIKSNKVEEVLPGKVYELDTLSKMTYTELKMVSAENGFYSIGMKKDEMVRRLLELSSRRRPKVSDGGRGQNVSHDDKGNAK